MDKNSILLTCSFPSIYHVPQTILQLHIVQLMLFSPLFFNKSNKHKEKYITYDFKIEVEIKLSILLNILYVIT